MVFKVRETAKLTAYKQNKKINLSKETFDKNNVQKLDDLTIQFLK